MWLIYYHKALIFTLLVIRLGHSDIGITTRVYSYLIDEYTQKSDDKIDQSINKLIQTKKNDTKIN